MTEDEIRLYQENAQLVLQVLTLENRMKNANNMIRSLSEDLQEQNERMRGVVRIGLVLPAQL